jgi:cobyrinic acid a,c-diamide synthase
MPIAITGTHSGAGKTTVTLAILAGLRHWDMSVQSFKVGPDYIDPMFHFALTGRPCRNLDLVLTSPEYVSSCFAKHSAGVEGAVIEGVMGLFDGAGSDEFGSTAHIVKLLGESISTILVVDCSRMSRSLAATIYGYHHFDPDIKLSGVILNRVGSDRHREILLEAIAPLGIPVLGILTREDGIKLSDRHLGLVPTEEVTNFREIADRLTELGQHCFDWERLMPLIKNSRDISSNFIPHTCVSAGTDTFRAGTVALPLQPLQPQSQPPNPSQPRIAVARDRAFNFYYADNLELLEHLGAELVYWSPLEDEKFPDHIQGLYFGGGFPEMFAAQLAKNKEMLTAIVRCYHKQLPIYAECGGLMYLSQAITDFHGNKFDMVGVLPTQTIMTDKLTLGYRRCLPLHPRSLHHTNPTPIWGHEFHRSRQTASSNHPLHRLRDYADRDLGTEGWSGHNFWASYVHLHWGIHPAIVKGFIEATRSPQVLSLSRYT